MSVEVYWCSPGVYPIFSGNNFGILIWACSKSGIKFKAFLKVPSDSSET
jgi:hypothetical protein